MEAFFGCLERYCDNLPDQMRTLTRKRVLMGLQIMFELREYASYRISEYYDLSEALHIFLRVLAHKDGKGNLTIHFTDSFRENGEHHAMSLEEITDKITLDADQLQMFSSWQQRLQTKTKTDDAFAQIIAWIENTPQRSNSLNYRH